MIKFFRRIRQQLLSEGKIRQYLFYALGEILLVVIGILIALQINNANEDSKQKRKAENYRLTLTSELNADLSKIGQLDSLYQRNQEDINHYLQLVKDPAVGTQQIIQEMDKVNYFGDYFESVAYSIDDIINSGNLELFDDEVKLAILEFKATQEFYDKNRAEVEQKMVLSTNEFERSVDLLSLSSAPSDLKDPNDWRLNLRSKQYQLFNNMTLAVLRTYYFRTDQNNKARQSIDKLLSALENN